MPTDRQPTYLDLFAGCGGLSLGFRQAGFRSLLAVDIDPQAVETYNFNFHESGPGAVQADLAALRSHDDVAAFLAEFGIGAADCDVLVGGPPCQSFSTVGRTKVRALMEADERMRERWEQQNALRTSLFEAYVLFLEYLQPRWFLFENVPAIRSHTAFHRIRDRFASLRTADGLELSYAIVPENYWASDFGVPQHRRRFLMVGHRTDAGIPHWVRPTKLKGPTVREALGDLPSVPSGHRQHQIPYDAQPNSEYQSLIRQKPSGDACEFVFNHVGRSHNADDIELFRRMVPGAKFSDPEVQAELPRINPQHKLLKYSVEKFQDKLHKLDPSRPSWTVTAHLQKDCYKFIHYLDARTVTVREAARLQSFPDWFFFPTAMGTAYRLIGNAIPPLLAQAFAQSFHLSDAGLTSGHERVRAILPDEEWRSILAVVGGGAKNPRFGLQLRRVLAAGQLVISDGRPWSDAARVLGTRNPLRLERQFRLISRTGIWNAANSVGWGVANNERDVRGEPDYVGDVAAD
jgi:DNA (cytosine-5)-methyltransferase 1